VVVYLLHTLHVFQ